MKKVTIVIETENAAFEDLPLAEVARILKKVAEGVCDRAFLDQRLYDINGNDVGYVATDH